MHPYKNVGGNSNVKAYEIGSDYIIVQFAGGRCYMYNYEATGMAAVEKMKALALAGRGLGAMLATKPYHKEARKWQEMEK